MNAPLLSEDTAKVAAAESLNRTLYPWRARAVGLVGIASRELPAAQPLHDAGRQLPDGSGFTAPVRSFHAVSNSPEAQNDHA